MIVQPKKMAESQRWQATSSGTSTATKSSLDEEGRKVKEAERRSERRSATRQGDAKRMGEKRAKLMEAMEKRKDRSTAAKDRLPDKQQPHSQNKKIDDYFEPKAGTRKNAVGDRMYPAMGEHNKRRMVRDAPAVVSAGTTGEGTFEAAADSGDWMTFQYMPHESPTLKAELARAIAARRKEQSEMRH
jgi:exonuclease VII large subunit